jgi:hypothetical protein
LQLLLIITFYWAILKLDLLDSLDSLDPHLLKLDSVETHQLLLIAGLSILDTVKSENTGSSESSFSRSGSSESSFSMQCSVCSIVVFPIRYIPIPEYRYSGLQILIPRRQTGKNLPVFAGIENIKMATFDQAYYLLRKNWAISIY